MKVKVGVSARHIHLTKEDIETLFGKSYKLSVKNELSQPGQYSCEEVLTIKTKKAQITGVRVIGPERDKTQVELSKTDAFRLGLNPPVRNSGCLEDASLITIIGPKGSLEKNCAIIATRHIHISKEDAKNIGIFDKKTVSIKVTGEKMGILENVYVRVMKDSVCEIHLDTDDANAFLIKNGDLVELLK